MSCSPRGVWNRGMNLLASACEDFFLTLSEDESEISETGAGHAFQFVANELDASATTIAGGRGDASAGAGHLQTTDRNQYDGLGRQRDGSLGGDGAALSRRRLRRERHSGTR